MTTPNDKIRSRFASFILDEIRQLGAQLSLPTQASRPPWDLKPDGMQRVTW
jgi:hypothetical protein